MLLYFIICYKNRSIAETFNENPGEKYLFSLYLIPIHDFTITFCVYLSLDGLVCFFFFLFLFTACNYYPVVCTCIVVLLHSELESSFNPIIFPSKSDHESPSYHWCFLKMEVPSLCPMLTKSKSLGVVPRIWIFNKFLSDSYTLKFGYFCPKLTSPVMGTVIHRIQKEIFR